MNTHETLAHDISDELIVLNDNDEKSESIQFKANDNNHDVNCTDKFDNAFSHNSISELVDNDFNLKILLFNFTATDNSDVDDHNDNNSVITDKCSVLTEQQRAVLSCCDFILHCDDSDKSENDYIFDIFITDEDENDKNV